MFHTSTVWLLCMMWYKKYQCSNFPCRKGTKPRITLATKKLPHYTLYRSIETEKKTVQKRFIITSHRTLILLRNVCICSLNNFNWSSVFYRLRDTHSSVTKADSLWSSIPEAHLCEEKIIPTCYQGRYSNFCNLGIQLFCIVTWQN